MQGGWVAGGHKRPDQKILSGPTFACVELAACSVQQGRVG